MIRVTVEIDASSTVAPEPGVPQVVERGEGVAPYRARKAPEAHVVHLCGFDEGIVAFRCHDVDVAMHAVGEAVLADRIPPDLAEELVTSAVVVDPHDTTGETARIRAERVWLRWVPEDPAKPTNGGVWERELRGTVGATPGVLFARPTNRKATP